MYEFSTSFWMDFSIAEKFGITSVVDTYQRAFEAWKSNYQYLTELVMVLNHKIWQHYKTDEDLARVYNELWMQADRYACENLTGDELTYFFRVTD